MLKQIVDAGEDHGLVFLADDEVQWCLAIVGGQVHRKLVLLYQDLQAFKLAALGCKVDGSEPLWGPEQGRRTLSRIGAPGSIPDLGSNSSGFLFP